MHRRLIADSRMRTCGQIYWPAAGDSVDCAALERLIAHQSQADAKRQDPRVGSEGELEIQCVHAADTFGAPTAMRVMNDRRRRHRPQRWLPTCDHVRDSASGTCPSEMLVDQEIEEFSLFRPIRGREERQHTAVSDDQEPPDQGVDRHA